MGPSIIVGGMGLRLCFVCLNQLIAHEDSCKICGQDLTIWA